MCICIDHSSTIFCKKILRESFDIEIVKARKVSVLSQKLSYKKKRVKSIVNALFRILMILSAISI